MEQQKKQSNLLELVDACETYHFNSGDPDDDIRLLKAQELRELGFTAKAEELEQELNRKIKLSRIENEKYIAISDEMIQKFLNKKTERYDADHKPKLEMAENDDPEIVTVRQPPHPYIPEAPSGRIFNAMREGALDYLSHINPFAPNVSSLTYINDQMQESGRLFQQRQQEYELRQNPYPYDSEMQRYRRELQRRIMEQQAQMNAWNSLANPTLIGFLDSSSSKFTAKTCDFLNTEEGTIGKYEWKEEKIKDYKGIPPEDVLEVLKEHKDKQLFDYFTIASVNAVKDPLLLGRIEGVKERFFIAQWGIDVSLDDIL